MPQFSEGGIGEWNSYAAAWSSSGTQPSLGNGTLVGRFCIFGDSVLCAITLTAGSTTTFGTGTYSFSLPVTAAQQAFFGSCFAFDSSATARYALLARPNGASLIQFLTMAVPGTIVTNTAPFTWAQDDTLGVSLAYEAIA